jgi:uncharacterized membrane protein HdeD (DUF308 family)
MRVVIVRHWWLLAIRGAGATGLGLASSTDRFGSVAALIGMFVVYGLIEAACLLASARSRLRMRSEWRWLAAEAVPSLLVAVALILAGGLAVSTLSWLLASWALGRGGIVLADVSVHRQWGRGKDLLRTADGLWAVVFAVWVLLDPGPGGLTAVTWLGTYTLGTGILQIARAYSLRWWPAWREPVAVVRWPGWSAFQASVLRGLRLRTADRTLARDRQK